MWVLIVYNIGGFMFSLCGIYVGSSVYVGVWLWECVLIKLCVGKCWLSQVAEEGYRGGAKVFSTSKSLETKENISKSLTHIQ